MYRTAFLLCPQGTGSFNSAVAAVVSGFFLLHFVDNVESYMFWSNFEGPQKITGTWCITRISLLTFFFLRRYLLISRRPSC